MVPINRKNPLFAKIGGVNQGALAVFTRELATMFKAGLPLARCLDVLSSRGGENPKLESTALELQEQVRAGKSFYEAVLQHPDVFNPVYLALVKSGEISGHLGEILERLAFFLEKDAKLRQSARAAMTYPILVFAFCVLLSVGLVSFIFPKFIDLFHGLNVPMPWPTRVLTALVDTMRNPVVLFMLLALFIFLAVVLSRYLRTPGGRRQWHQLLLTLPVVGPIHRKIAISRFARTFATLYGSGVPVLQAMDVVSQVSGNEILNDAVLQAREAVKYGSNISAPLEESALFPPMVTGLIRIGEQSGHLQNMLTKISEYYEMEVEMALASLSKLLEPILILILGFVVGFVLIAIFLPIYGLIGNLK